jgi:hypothetical protein
MSELLPILREFGFPILVCCWFMLRLEKRMDKISGRIHRLITVNTVLVKAIDAQEFDEELNTLEDEED